uniref:Sodium/potassium-transporting ATPase subunit beta-1-interacting protein n=1 Tax=Anopheles christyi TaxID=43041 RepID=A0A182KDF2_9DIPT
MCFDFFGSKLAQGRWDMKVDLPIGTKAHQLTTFVFVCSIPPNKQDSDLLNLGTGSVSWFEENGYGCRPTYPTNVTSEDPYRPVRPEKVDGCLLEYHIVEVVHSGIHCALAIFGIFGAICLGQTFLDEDDSCKYLLPGRCFQSYPVHCPRSFTTAS